jgi:signal transduction histidine kinase
MKKARIKKSRTPNPSERPAAESAPPKAELERENLALSETSRMLSGLQAIAAAASGSLDINRALHAAVEKLAEVCRFDVARIYLCDELTGSVYLKASFDDDPARIAATGSFANGEGIVGWVTEAEQSLIFDNLHVSPLYRRLSRTKVMKRFGYHFVAVFPIKSKEKTLGAIACAGKAPRRLRSSEVNLLDAVAERIAVAIENCRLHQGARRSVQELELKAAALAQAGRIKDELIEVATHELGTPLNVIMGFTAAFKDGVFGDITPLQRDALARIGRESQDLVALVGSLQNASALETGMVANDTQEFSAENFLEDLGDKYAVTVPPGVKLQWQYPDNLPVLATDRRKLIQILDNLIGNAVKFTAQGTVTVTARATGIERQGCPDSSDDAEFPATDARGSWIEFKVMDTGAGIPPEALARVFDKFYRAESSDTKRYGGAGLGLYIARKLTEQLGGTIEAESVAGGGSAFTVRLPAAPQPGLKRTPFAQPLITSEDRRIYV